MLPAFASVDELADRVPGGIEAGDEARAQAALDDASALIRAETGRSWVTDGELDLPTGDDEWKADILAKVCLGAALRSFLNPDNRSGESESIDGYSHSEQWSNSSPDVYLSSSEKAQLARTLGGGGLFVISTTRSDIGASGRSGGLETSRCDDTGTEYLDVVGAGTKIPFTGPDGY